MIRALPQGMIYGNWCLTSSYCTCTCHKGLKDYFPEGKDPCTWQLAEGKHQNCSPPPDTSSSRRSSTREDLELQIIQQAHNKR